MKSIMLFAIMAFGAILIYQSQIRQPKGAAVRAVSRNKAYGLTDRINRLVSRVARPLSCRIRMADYKQAELSRMLSAFHINATPEQYTAEVLVKAAAPLLLGALLSFRSLLMLPLSGVVAALIYIQSMDKIKTRYLARQKEIEGDLPKLCSVICSRLRSTANVQQILEAFRPIASPAMREEVNKTILDMQTGNGTAALLNLEHRVGSAKLSDVCRGLIAVLAGDDQISYFTNKRYQLNMEYISTQKKDLQERPGKLMANTLLLVIMFLVLILYPMLTGTSNSMSTLF